MMEAMASQAILQNIIYKRKKGFPLPTHNFIKPLYQAVSALLPTGNSARTAYLHCIKLGTNIDPPYNTGNDFIYKDNFSMDKDEYEEEIGLYDEEDNRLFKNTQTNGRFHSDWCSMIYSRLKLSQNLLSEDGVIFISIDDNEVDNLRKICDDIFGENNFITNLVWEKKKKGSFLSKSITNVKEYVLVYCKSMNDFKGLIGEINSDVETYPCINAVNKRELRIIPSGITSKYKEKDYFLPKGTEISDTTMSIVLHSDLVIKNGILNQELILEGNWRYSQDAITEYARKREIYITRDLYLRRIVSDVRFKTLKDILPRLGEDNGSAYNEKIDINDLFKTGWGSNEDADEELRLLLGVQKIIDYPKPVRLIYKLIASYRQKNITVLDFFSGSATTAHSIMQLNAEDGGNRKFIMVQLPEPTSEGSAAFKAGYKNISEIGKERIRRAGEKIKEENKDKEGIDNLDIGFRVLKVDTTNMKDVYYAANEYTQSMLAGLESNIKEDRTDLDLLYGVLLDWGLPLSLKHKIEEIEGVSVHTVDEGSLVACFAEKISEKVVREIAKRQPLRVVFRDSSFANSPDKINVEEIFKLLAPNTTVKVI
jgi:adenine-specific DNA-methyltransferase